MENTVEKTRKKKNNFEMRMKRNEYDDSISKIL